MFNHVVFSLEEKHNTGVIQIREEVGHASPSYTASQYY
jgi:hypothetical protein